MAIVFKIMGKADYSASKADGFAVPAAVDRADGFIHLSTEEQALATARLHFAGRDDLVIVGFDAGPLGAALRWEASRGGAMFPHFYGALKMAHAVSASSLKRRADGSFVFGEPAP